jgi:hypothetical protein
MELVQFEWNLNGMFSGLGTCFVLMVVNRDYNEYAQGCVEHTFTTIQLHQVNISSNVLLIFLGTF